MKLQNFSVPEFYGHDGPPAWPCLDHRLYEQAEVRNSGVDCIREHGELCMCKGHPQRTYISCWTSDEERPNKRTRVVQAGAAQVHSHRNRGDNDVALPCERRRRKPHAIKATDIFQPAQP